VISPELIKKIRGIQIKTNYLVNDIMAGEYKTAFRGRGMEFEDVREYQAGDDIRAIDWNVTARMNAPFVKTFREERELTVMLMVDVSSSGEFGSVGELKSDRSAIIASILAYSAIKNNDKVGLIVFSDRIEKYIPPKKGRSHVWGVIKTILSHDPKSDEKRGTNLASPLEFLSKVCRRKTVSFLISDFIAEGYERAIRIFKKRHDLIAITITDPREMVLPAVGLVELQDAETGERIVIDTSDPIARKEFSALYQRELKDRDKLFRSMSLDKIEIFTDKPYIEPIMKFFRMREKRL
jgi:uncharacterized protein (DUF58 family)